MFKKITLFFLLLILIFINQDKAYAFLGFGTNSGFVMRNDFDNGTLKGFNVGELKSDYDSRYMDELANTGANIVRVIVPFTLCPEDKDHNISCIYQVSPDNVKNIQNMSKVFSAKKIKIIISAIFYEKNKGDFWKNKELQKGMSDAWTKFADQIKEDKNIAALELYYSPDASQLPNIHKESRAWSIAGYNMIKAIRNVDPNHVIIFQVPEGDPKNIEGLLDLNDSNIVYGFDMFYPTQITLQGLYNYKKYPYPLGAEYGLDSTKTGIAKVIDKSALNDYLKPIIDFKSKGNSVFISSWGIVYYAPQDSSYRYVSDVLSILSQNKIGWAYYGFRINKFFDPFIAGTKISDTQRTPEASLITLLRESMTGKVE